MLRAIAFGILVSRLCWTVRGVSGCTRSVNRAALAGLTRRGVGNKWTRTRIQVQQAAPLFTMLRFLLNAGMVMILSESILHMAVLSCFAHILLRIVDLPDPNNVFSISNRFGLYFSRGL